MSTMKILPTVTAGAIDTVASPAALPPTEKIGAIRYSESDDTLYTFDGTSWSPVTGGGGSGITELTGDVTAGPGSGSQAATVVSVGGASAASVAQSVTDTQAATSANTPSTIVKRDGSGNFAAGTITAALTGTASGNPPNSRTIATTAPLAGGGDLSANRTLSIPVSTNSVDGYLSGADHTTFAAKVSPTRAINTTAPLTGGGDLSADRTLAIPAATNSVDGYLTAADHTTFSAASAAAITSLTGDVTASGPGAAAATVVNVGGTLAALIAAGANLANGSSASNTGGVIVRRDALGSFTASTITGSSFVGPLTGNVTGNASGTAANVTGTVAIANGGTGQTSAANAINALLPSQTGQGGNVLGTNGSVAAWVPPTASSSSAAYSSPSTTVVLTNADNKIQVFSPTADIDVRLPSTGVLAGDIWQITNTESAFRIQIVGSAGTSVNYLFPGTSRLMAKINTPLVTTDWYEMEPVEATNIPFTGGGSWTTNTTYYATFSRNNDYITVRYLIKLSGAPDAATKLVLDGIPFFTPNIGVPAQAFTFESLAGNFGIGSAYQAGSSTNFFLTMSYNPLTGWEPIFFSTNGGSGDPVRLQNNVYDTTPFTFVSGDLLQITWTYPVVELS